MSFYNNLYFIETTLNIENIKIRACINENLFATGKGCIASTHNHSFYEIRYYSSGSGEIVIGENHMKIFPGALYIIHPNEYHYQDKLSIDEGISQYSIGFTPIMPNDDASKIQKSAYKKLCEAISSMHYISDTSLSILPYFEGLVSEIQDRKYGHVGCTNALLTIIMTKILREAAINDKKLGMAHTNDFILETDAFFSKEFLRKTTLEDYARELNISPRHASRIIRKNFGMSFVEKLTETRIEHAKVALADTQDSLNHIATSCGFQSYGYFITCFRKNTGMTPAQYRKSKT